jgi:putative transposase
MSRLRRIADQDRIFFITTNLLKDCPPLTPSERDLILSSLGDVRTRCPFILLGYVVMPTHAHLLLAVQSISISQVMHQWKFKSGHRVQQLRGTQRPFWQPRYFDFICRHARDVSNKLDYIHQNPVQAGFVRQPDEWPWSSAAFYSKSSSLPSSFPPLSPSSAPTSPSSSLPLVPDQMDFSGDPDELLWPAPRRPL